MGATLRILNNMLEAKKSFLLINWTWQDQSNLLSINMSKYLPVVIHC